MVRPRVYVETTIPSFYHEERSAPDIVARREWTRQWWSDAAERYELATSPAVLNELAGENARDLVEDNEKRCNHPSVGSCDNILLPSIYPANTRHVPTTGTRGCFGRDFREVSGVISNQRHAEVVKTGSDDSR